VQIPFAVRRVFEQLPELRQVPPGRGDVAVRLDHVDPQRFTALGTQRWVVARRQQDIVALPHRERAEDRLDHAVPDST